MLYAIILNGIVQSVIEADAAFIAANYPGAPRVDNLSPQPGIGWSYAAGVFTPPAAPPAGPAPAAAYSHWGFRQLFTMAELLAIDNFATNTTLTPAQIAQINTITKNFEAADDLNLSDPATQAGVNYLATAQPNGPALLTAARAAAILAGQAPPAQ